MEAIRSSTSFPPRLLSSIFQSLRPLRRSPRPSTSVGRATYTSTPPRPQPETAPPPPLQGQSQAQAQVQAQPLAGYYADLLASSPSPTTTTTTTPSSSTAQESKESRARVIFGTRLAGSGYISQSTTPDASWQVINGVAVPPRPEEPDNCCMSGCVHCVWDDYRDEVEGWAGRVRKARARMGADGIEGERKGEGIKERGEVREASRSVDEDGGGAGDWDGKVGRDGVGDGGAELFEAIPVGIREFMRTEKRLRERRRQERGDG